jgi:hypothetical protein
LSIEGFLSKDDIEDIIAHLSMLYHALQAVRFAQHFSYAVHAVFLLCVLLHLEYDLHYTLQYGLLNINYLRNLSRHFTRKIMHSSLDHVPAHYRSRENNKVV